MKRKSRPYAPDLREDWQVAQGLHCPCGGFDEMCVCQNVDEPWRYGRGGKPPSAQQDLEQRIRELEGTVRTLELQQQTDRQTIASLLAARPAVVSDEVVERMCRAHHETRRPAHETPAGGLTRWATWAEVCEVEDERDRRLAAMRAALALLPGGEGEGSSRSLPSRTTQEPQSPTPCDLEVTDRASQWMLENSEGRWLHNAEDGTFTSDPNLGLKWPNRTAADAFRLGLRGPLWALKLTEHVWIEPEPYDWTDAEDDIADAISDSMDMDWSSRDGARAVVAYLKQIGAKLP